MGSNLKGNPSDLDDCRRLDFSSDQREDNVTAAVTSSCNGCAQCFGKFTGSYHTRTYFT